MEKLIQFSVGNYRSFYKRRTFTFEPTGIHDEPHESIACVGRQRFSTVSAVYGANSSGKSNLVNAIALMGDMVLQSVKLNDGEELTYEPYLLSDRTAESPMYLEAVYLSDGGRRVRYGFESDSTRVVREWLFTTVGTQPEQVMFLRDTEGIAVDGTTFAEGIDREEMTNDNRLFLSLCAQLGGDTSKGVIAFFNDSCNVISGIDNKGYRSYTKRMFRDQDKLSDEAMDFFRFLQLGFTGIQVEEQEIDLSDLPEQYRPTRKPVRLEVFSTHNTYASDGSVSGERRFAMAEHESSGTQKIFELSGPIFDTLERGSVLIVDELDAKMHPLISQQIVRLFTDTRTNPHHAQLLFTTHDTNLLSARTMRRDQIWFTEKDDLETTDLYRLTDIVLPDGTRPRGDGNLERNYIKGRYGAIPFLTNDTRF